MMTALSGTLIRHPHGWQWSDGTPASVVTDMTGSWYYNFRCRPGYVEVPLACAKRESELGWVWEGCCSGKYREALSGDHRGLKVLDVVERYQDGDIPGISEPETQLRHAGYTRADGGKRAIPRVALVPIAEWESWSQSAPLGARWNKEDEDAIFAKAESLGWKR